MQYQIFHLENTMSIKNMSITYTLNSGKRFCILKGNYFVFLHLCTTCIFRQTKCPFRPKVNVLFISNFKWYQVFSYMIYKDDLSLHMYNGKRQCRDYSVMKYRASKYMPMDFRQNHVLSAPKVSFLSCAKNPQHMETNS